MGFHTGKHTPASPPAIICLIACLALESLVLLLFSLNEGTICSGLLLIRVLGGNTVCRISCSFALLLVKQRFYNFSVVCTRFSYISCIVLDFDMVKQWLSMEKKNGRCLLMAVQARLAMGYNLCFASIWLFLLYACCARAMNTINPIT